jgi:hypothetical protein
VKDDVSYLDMSTRHTRIDGGTACSVAISEVAARKSSGFGEMMERKLANEQFLQHKNRGAYRIWYLFVIAAFV